MPRPLRVGVFGGSFDPIHLGHVQVITDLLLTKTVDTVVLVPTYDHPDKPDQAPFWSRYNMLAVIADRLSGLSEVCKPVTLSNVEEIIAKDQDESVRTWQVLERLHREYERRNIPQGYEFHLILGSDCWNEFMTWDRPDRTLNLAKIVVCVRSGYPVSSPPLLENGIVAPIPMRSTSSTMIRRMIREGESITWEVPNIIAKIIKRQELYQEGQAQ